MKPRWELLARQKLYFFLVGPCLVLPTIAKMFKFYAMPRKSNSNSSSGVSGETKVKQIPHHRLVGQKKDIIFSAPKALSCLHNLR